HGLFTGSAQERLSRHPMISEVVTTDTVPAPPEWHELTVRSVSQLFAEAIRRVHEGESVSSLFDGVDPTHARPQPSLFAPDHRAMPRPDSARAPARGPGLHGYPDRTEAPGASWADRPDRDRRGDVGAGVGRGSADGRGVPGDRRVG